MLSAGQGSSVVHSASAARTNFRAAEAASWLPGRLVRETNSRGMESGPTVRLPSRSGIAPLTARTA